jgi:hypothetical protein
VTVPVPASPTPWRPPATPPSLLTTQAGRQARSRSPSPRAGRAQGVASGRVCVCVCVGVVISQHECHSPVPAAERAEGCPSCAGGGPPRPLGVAAARSRRSTCRHQPATQPRNHPLGTIRMGGWHLTRWLGGQRCGGTPQRSMLDSTAVRCGAVRCAYRVGVAEPGPVDSLATELLARSDARSAPPDSAQRELHRDSKSESRT